MDAILQQLAEYIAELFRRLIADLQGFLTNLVNQFAQWFTALASSLNTFIANAIDRLVTTFNNLFDSILRSLSSLTDTIGRAIDGLINRLQAAMANLISTLEGVLSQVVGRVFQVLEDLWARFQAGFIGVIDKIGNFINSLWVTLQAVAVNIVASVQGFIDETAGYLRDVLNNFVGFVADTVSRIAATIASVVNPVVSGISSTIETFRVRINQTFDTLIGGANSLISAINGALTNISTAFADAADKLAASIIESGEKTSAPLVKQLTDLSEGIRGLAWGAPDLQLEQALNQVIRPTTLVLEGRQDVYNLIQNLTPRNPITKAIWWVGLSFMVAWQSYKGIADANAQRVLAEYGAQYPYQLMTPADCANAMLRGELPRNEAVGMIQRQGFTSTDANRLLDNAGTVPPPDLALTMLVREDISLEMFHKATIQAGLSQAWEDAYRRLAIVIPPIQDLIQFAVKGAFSPDEVALFRTDEDFPVEVVAWAKKQGLTEDWVRKFWRAHWSLPSASQGFEMLQRDIIKEPELRVLLKALDVTPYWRDKMIALSYNVLTRVDVRRMYELGIFSDRSQVVRAYQDMGYSPKDAELLTQFTESQKPGDPADTDELRALTRTAVLGFFEDGTITDQRAVQLLTKQGITAEAAELYIHSVTVNRERADRKLLTDSVVDLAAAGVLDFTDALSRLANLGLTETEIARVSARLEREQARQSKLPTKEDGAKFYAAKVITELEYRQLLTRLGYSKPWVEAYVALAKKGITSGQAS